MTKSLARGTSMLSFVVATLVACTNSSTPEPGDDSGGSGGSVAGRSGGSAGGSAGTAGSPVAGGAAGTSGSGGQAGTGGGLAGAGGSTAGMSGSAGTPPMAGMAGAAGAGGSGGTPNTPAAFTADFENGVVGMAPPSPFSGGGANIKVDDGKAFSGKKSVKVYSASGSNMFLMNPKAFIAPNRKTVYTRFMLWLDNLPGTSGGADPATRNHWDLIKYMSLFKGGGFNINGFLSFGGFAESGNKLHMFGDDTANKGRQDCSKSSPMYLKTKKWTCVEMKVDENDVINYGVSLDGEEIQQFSFLYDSAASNCVPAWDITQGVWYLPEVTAIALGFNNVHEQPTPVTLWIDDVAVSSKPIGCPAAM